MLENTNDPSQQESVAPSDELVSAVSDAVASSTEPTDAPSSEILVDADASTVEEEEERGSSTLEEALEKYGIELSPKKVGLLKRYCDLLWLWNERLNLTRHTTFDKFVSHDLVDSMRLAELLQKGEHVLDVGSGGGVPGLVVAILRPDVAVELSDATGKKAEALGAIVDALDLDVNVWYAKAEDLLKTRRFHTLTVRAVGKMRSLLQMFAPVWYAFDRVLMIKGPNWPAERGEARHYNMLNSLALRKVAEYETPGADHISCILQLCQKSKFQDIERRAAERLEGKPYDGEIEEIVVDNRPPKQDEEKSQRRRAPRGRSVRADRPYIKLKDRRGDSKPNDVEAKPNASGESNGVEAKVRLRKNSQPPKGWTGKKREFREQVQGGETDGGDRRNYRGGRGFGASSSEGGEKKPFRGGRSGGRGFGGSSDRDRGGKPRRFGAGGRGGNNRGGGRGGDRS